jgi:hypothetical protein
MPSRPPHRLSTPWFNCGAPGFGRLPGGGVAECRSLTRMYCDGKPTCAGTGFFLVRGFTMFLTSRACDGLGESPEKVSLALPEAYTVSENSR